MNLPEGRWFLLMNSSKFVKSHEENKGGNTWIRIRRLFLNSYRGRSRHRARHSRHRCHRCAEVRLEVNWNALKLRVSDQLTLNCPAVRRQNIRQRNNKIEHSTILFIDLLRGTFLEGKVVCLIDLTRKFYPTPSDCHSAWTYPHLVISLGLASCVPSVVCRNRCCVCGEYFASGGSRMVYLGPDAKWEAFIKYDTWIDPDARIPVCAKHMNGIGTFIHTNPLFRHVTKRTPIAQSEVSHKERVYVFPVVMKRVLITKHVFEQIMKLLKSRTTPVHQRSFPGKLFDFDSIDEDAFPPLTGLKSQNSTEFWRYVLQDPNYTTRHSPLRPTLWGCSSWKWNWTLVTEPLAPFSGSIYETSAKS